MMISSRKSSHPRASRWPRLVTPSRYLVAFPDPLGYGAAHTTYMKTELATPFLPTAQPFDATGADSKT